MGYPEDLSRLYSEQREQYNEGSDAELFSALKETGVQEKTVLDIGCGDGRHARMVAALGARLVTGIDSSAGMIKLAQEKSKDSNVVYLEGSAESIPVPDGSQDIVISNFALQHCKELDVVFLELNRVLKAGGTSVIVLNVSEVEEGFDFLINTEIPIRLNKEVVVQDLIKPNKGIHKALAASGLEVVREAALPEDNAGLDDAYPYKDKVKVGAVLFVLKKPS